MTGRLPEDGDEGVESVFSEINITPLTDIFLVLLIIFMVGASMAVDAASGGGDGPALAVDLPKGAARDMSPGSGDVAVVILADGRVLVGGDEVADDILVEALRAAREERAAGASTLIVQADEGVHHGRVVSVMESAREAGFTKLAVATRGE